MKRKRNRNRLALFTIVIVAAIAICWDIAVSTLDIEPGTFRYESEFDAVTGATATVSIVTSDYTDLVNPIERTTNPSYEQIEDMVGKAIELQGGFEWVIDKGDVVIIKVNLVGGTSHSGDGENTDVRVVKALIRHIHQYTEGDVEIQVAEGTARINDDPTDPLSVWGNCGYIDLLTDTMMTGINFSLLNINQSVEDLIEVDLGSEGTSAKQGSKYFVHKAELEADVYIAVPVLKIHNTGITNALKLQIGSAPGCYYGYNKTQGTDLCPDGLYHDIDHRVWTTEAIVDLCNIADIDFVLVDAVMCLEIAKSYNPERQVRFNTILAGADPVAVDHVSAKLMGLNPDDVAHITLAEKVGLGTNDPEHISIVGVPLSQAMKKVKKSQSSDGKFGQSNRTWILSRAFDGTDISTEYINDETTLEPVPGESGWSQPVYFFDDRIDLHSYYAGQTGIVSYAFTYFNAEKAQEAELWLGTQEAIQVFLNGEQVYSFNSVSSYGDGDRGDSKGLVNILQGRNTLLVKTLNNFGDYSFALNICEVESDPYYFGNRVAGLKFYTSLRAIAVTGVSLDKDTLSVEAEATGVLSATVEPAEADNKKVTWSSSNNAIATVSDGTVSGVAAGDVYVFVTTADGGFKDSCLVTVSSSIGISNREMSGVNLYPNPVTDGVLYIQLPDNTDVQHFEVYNVHGVLMLRESVNSRSLIRINTKTLPEKGVYFIRFGNSQKNYVEQIIVQ